MIFGFYEILSIPKQRIDAFIERSAEDVAHCGPLEEKSASTAAKNRCRALKAK